MQGRYLGIDVGAETVKVLELLEEDGELRTGRREIREHGKEPADVLRKMCEEMDWKGVDSAAVGGRLSRGVRLLRVPVKQALARGFRHLCGDDEGTVVSIGSHGFSVLEMRASGLEVFRENSRCSQGTGNFLRQLVERFDMDIEKAGLLCETVDDPAPLSGRCPVILKTDMTHLANKGESRARILAGLYDAVCENVQVLLKPKLAPPRVMLAGGVTRSGRIREHFARFCEKHRMVLMEYDEEQALFLEALGCALVARENRTAVPNLEDMISPLAAARLDIVPSPKEYIHMVNRMSKKVSGDPDSASRAESNSKCREHSMILGFDMGSTGSKVVAMSVDTKEVLWEGYINTNGNPVEAAKNLMQQFVDGPAGSGKVVSFGATGSGREIVGSLLSTCYGVDKVFVLNEIAAHAEGAMSFDPEVDTIFEIGGQDAKYIRLAGGRVVDAAMNEACSAGTGSFIEEQGKKFSGIRDVVHLGDEALSAASGVSLGQHCSVFMAEIIDEAVAAGVENRSIIAGIYDSIIQNYLNRVKGNRSVGDVIFCQGMPFSSDALTASVARQTSSRVVVPPNPGTVGALGIGLLARKNMKPAMTDTLDPGKFLEARMLLKDTFICKSKRGCGGAGNHCRIDRITTLVEGRKQRFMWGGGCSMWDRGTGKRKLPDLSPDPFREREDLVQEVIDGLPNTGDRPVIALADEFQLKGLFPFYLTFLSELGFDLNVQRSADQALLKRGIEEANVPFCAPMQQYHGLAAKMAEADPDYLFIPMIRTLQKCGDEQYTRLCPIVQASPDMLKWDLGKDVAEKILSPVIDVGVGNLESREFVKSCQSLAAQLGVFTIKWWKAYEKALAIQQRFECQCEEIGVRAVEFCRKSKVVPVVVLGRTYTIYNDVLNSNVPKILREQGSMAIPVDCYPVFESTPVFNDIYWGYGQRNLRVVQQIRQTPGVYSLWCSNYSCGPDSFVLHFYSYLMEGKPFAVIETDGHSGDAGTKTRVEAFLHCVREDLENNGKRMKQNCMKALERDTRNLPQIRRNREHVLIPRMGQGAEILAAALRGTGVSAESLPMPDPETVTAGRRYTSGKECVPMTVTTGSLIQRLEREKDPDRKFVFLMPKANGPCRFGCYNTLHKIILERLGWKDRVRVWSPVDSGYFEGTPPGLEVLIFSGFVAADMLLNAYYDAAATEIRPGAARQVHDRYFKALTELCESAASANLMVANTLLQVVNGRLFGVSHLMRKAAAEFAAIKEDRPVPTVSVVGEIYVRCDPFSNDFVNDRLLKRGIRPHFAPFIEWLEYTDHVNWENGDSSGLGAQFSSVVQRRVQNIIYNIVARALKWSRPTTVKKAIDAASPYLRSDLTGEAVLTIGGPVHEWREGEIDGVISVGPLECMPNKISEAQMFHVAEVEGLPSLTISLNGDPVDPEILDNFAFEVKEGFRKGRRPRKKKTRRIHPSIRFDSPSFTSGD